MNTNAKNIIQVDKLSKQFGSVRAVDKVSFAVHEGEIFAFLGPNGAGKTTTIKMLTTLLQPSSGRMQVNSFNPVSESHEVRKSFGIVFQDPSLDDELTAWENLEFHGVLYHVPQPIRKQRMQALLDFIGLEDRKKDLVKTFSGGMKRRLEIARALLHHPKILFLDEPTIGLDVQTRNGLWNYVREMQKKEGLTVLFTTHYLEEAEKIANRIAIIDHGKLVQEGTSTEIMHRTRSKTLEEAFLKLTGHSIREEGASAHDRLRMEKRLWRGR